MNKIKKSNEEWRKELTPEQYNICREKGTEKPFSGQDTQNFEPGTYRCVCCGNPVFASENKFDSGCGWPSFTNPIIKTAVEESDDNSHNMHRTEVTCSQCAAHLGHLFDDGPQPTGLRFCINSAALKFEKK